MPIHMGIMCGSCRKIYFIAASKSIRPILVTPGMYRLNCTCSEAREFRKEAMQPYRVADHVFNRGYAKLGEYELMQPS